MQKVLDEAHLGAAHGGRFFEAIGTRFDDLSRRHEVIPADVLDAWFDPAPAVLEALRGHLAFALRTSPPVVAGGLIAEIARQRGIAEPSLAVGGGSSDLIYAVLPLLLGASAKIALVRPSYSEYAHLATALGCEVVSFDVHESDGFAFDAEGFAAFLRRTGPAVAVLVRPNNPVGGCVERRALLNVVDNAPQTTFLIDEAYIDYAHLHETVERAAAARTNLIVLKSMSKVYALSGARAAYLSANPALVKTIRRLTPPWAVSLPAQIAAVAALSDPGYYAHRYAETRVLRSNAVRAAREQLDLGAIEPLVPAYLAKLPSRDDADSLVRALEGESIFIRSCNSFGSALERFVRISVRSALENERILERLGAALA